MIPSEELENLIKLHNESREKVFLFKRNSLTKDDMLMKYAQQWADYMADTTKLKHSKMKSIMSLGFSTAGENISYGQKDSEEAMRTWLKSPGHRSNILNSSYNSIGCGVSIAENGTPYWCVCFGKK